jgi:hypothetical protein
MFARPTPSGLRKAADLSSTTTTDPDPRRHRVTAHLSPRARRASRFRLQGGTECGISIGASCISSRSCQKKEKKKRSGPLISRHLRYLYSCAHREYWRMSPSNKTQTPSLSRKGESGRTSLYHKTTEIRARSSPPRFSGCAAMIVSRSRVGYFFGQVLVKVIQAI